MTQANLAREIVSRQRDLRKNAYLYNNTGLSYSSLFQRSASLAQALRGLGLVSRQRIVISLYDSPAVSEIFLAALSIGAIPVVINPKLSRDSLSHIIADSGASLLACETDNLDTVRAVCADAATPPRLLLQDSYATVVPAKTGDKAADLLHLSALTQQQCAFEFTYIGENEAAFWQYTSGTTGRPKAVQHCSVTMLENTQAFAVCTHGFTSDDVFYSAAKMFFGYGFGASFFFPLLLGATAVLDSAMPSNDYAVLRNIAAHRPSAIFCAPALYAALLPHAARLKPYLSEDTVFISAGSGLPQSIFERWQEAFGLPIYDGIGSTEMGHIFLSNAPSSLKAGATGRPVVGYQVRLEASAQGQDGDGILWVKGRHPNLGYWNKPQASGEKFVDGWCCTGDLFSRDAEGFYTYRGRSDDLFKSNGIWVTPLAIESEIQRRLPQVLECALVPHQGDGELAEPVLFCVIDAKQCGQEEGITAVQAILGEVCEKHSLPKQLLALDALPRNDNGKVSRAALSKFDLTPAVAA
ncbi:AMP-binding protein [Pseudoduganella violacea]|uniref:Acyl-coenzyme A synthetase/AMP-(Fatty) acid ligase n=1 Tax=Pseudoduganella violacea TaxID=1715466 RepID=A0A7W5B6R8_9BURK|nr:AMP-binding protein [Pseudoduganella violacea]MBB3117579.1 acyl-coenzyme A synthetase/AMP-(fatty) acid ligase [Pseudoduganella violacea]